MRNWDWRKWSVQVNLRCPIRQEAIPIQRVRSLKQGLPNPIGKFGHLISHIRSYPPHRCHLVHRLLSSSSTTLPSSQNTQINHPSQYLHVMIMSCHWVQHSLSKAYTEYSMHRVQHPPKSEWFPFILIIMRLPVNVASDSGMRPYTIDYHPQAHYDSSTVQSHCYIPTIAS